MSIVPGSTIGKFKLECQLGGGGMGSVYKARDTKLGRTVAIKVLNSQYDYNLENIERFEREARTLASLNHPNLMHVYDVGTEESNHYFAMEYIEGRSLRDMIADPDYSISHSEALRITIEVMAGLRKVHNSGIIHRDIKPANIMIENSDGRAVLVDFGLSKSADDSGLTSAGSILGTPDYISPEQIEGFEAGYHSDIYSLGVVLYEMLCGENPYTRGSAMQTIRAHCNFNPPPLKKVVPRINRELSKIIDKMIISDAEQRYQSISELALDLLKACQHPLLDKLAADSTGNYHLMNTKQSYRSSNHQHTPYKHYKTQTPKIHKEFPFWKYFSGGVTVIGVLLLITFFYTENKSRQENNKVLSELKKYNLPIITYTPKNSTTEPISISNPSIIIYLSNGEQLWGRVLDDIHENRIRVGLFPKGQAEYYINEVDSIIMVDSEAISDTIPNPEDLVKRAYFNRTKLYPQE